MDISRVTEWGRRPSDRQGNWKSRGHEWWAGQSSDGGRSVDATAGGRNPSKRGPDRVMRLVAERMPRAPRDESGPAQGQGEARVERNNGKPSTAKIAGGPIIFRLESPIRRELSEGDEPSCERNSRGRRTCSGGICSAGNFMQIQGLEAGQRLSNAGLYIG